jgi:hypothetical protein
MLDEVAILALTEARKAMAARSSLVYTIHLMVCRARHVEGTCRYVTAPDNINKTLS